MNIVNINKELCTGCGLCASDCPAMSIKVTDGKATMGSSCIECGHCYAICPAGAISMNGYDTSNCGEMASMQELDTDTLIQAMKSRRTIRQFKDMPIEQEKLDKILEAGRYCPTGGNSQKICYTILGSQQDAIEKECVKMFRAGVKAGSAFSSFLKNKVIDDNFFFKKAPVVIVVSGTNSVDPSLASSYMELVAESMGIGVLYSGFFQMCATLNPKIKSMLKLPKGHKVVTCMVMGYPAVKYQRIVPRKPLNSKTL